MTSSIHRSLLIVAFALSGYAALTYEMSWTRQLVSLFGVTYHAITTILITFMSGLALGSWITGRVVDRMRTPPLLAFAVLEAFLAIYAQLFPHLQGLVELVYLALVQGNEVSLFWDTALRFLLGALILLPPALASGATLPVASRAFVSSGERLRKDLALLYGANVTGAAAGCVGTTFFTIGLLGYPATAWLGSAANGAACLIAVLLHLRTAPHGATATDGAGDRPPWDRRRAAVGAAYLVVGASAMALEILWTRVLSQACWNAATYVFGFVLASYLLGHALGAGLIFRHALIRIPARPLFVALVAGIALLTLLSVALLVPRSSAMDWKNVQLFTGLGLYLPPQRLWLVLPALVVPAMFSGAMFPLASHIVIREVGGLGRGVGNLAALATVGGIAGAFVTGFWLMPTLGTVWGLIIVGCVDLAAAVWAGWALLGRGANRPGLPLVATVAIAGACGLLIWLIPTHCHLILSPNERVIAFTEGRNSSTAVVQLNPQERMLLVHGERIQTRGGGTDVAMAARLHPRPRNIAIIGFGTGRVATDALKVAAYEKVTTVDFNGDLPAMAPLIRGDDAALLEGERFRFVDNDGRHFLLTTGERFDVIVNDAAIYAWYLELSTLEFSLLARSRLEPEGLYLGRLHTFRITRDAYRRELATFLRVFPNAAACMLSADIIMLIGRNGSRPIRRDGLCSFADQRWMDARTLAQQAGGAIITDDHPLHLPRTFLSTDHYPGAPGGTMPTDNPVKPGE